MSVTEVPPTLIHFQVFELYWGIVFPMVMNKPIYRIFGIYSLLTVCRNKLEERLGSGSGNKIVMIEG